MQLSLFNLIMINSVLCIVIGCDNNVVDSKIEKIDNEHMLFYNNLERLINPAVPTSERGDICHYLDSTSFPKHLFEEQRALDMLISGARNHDSTIRLYAVRLMRYTRNKKAFKVLEEIIKNEPDDSVKKTAYYSLATMREFGDAFTLLKDAFDSALETQSCIIMYMGFLQDERGDDFLYKYFDAVQNDENVKSLIIIALYQNRLDTLFHYHPVDKKFISFLIKVLDDQSQKIRMMAYFALLNCTGDRMDGFIPKELELQKYRSLNIDFIKIPQELEQNWQKYRDALKLWWETNADYLYMLKRDTWFFIDQEAKAAGIPTDEYRKTHPWPTDNKTPDEPIKDKPVDDK